MTGAGATSINGGNISVNGTLSKYHYGAASSTDDSSNKGHQQNWVKIKIPYQHDQYEQYQSKQKF